MVYKVQDKEKNQLWLNKEVTRGHNIVADGWAGASNTHPHPKPHSIHKLTIKESKTLIVLIFNGPMDQGTNRQSDGLTDQRTDGRTKPLIELRFRN